MGRAVRAHRPARSMAKRTGRRLDRHVVDDLVIAALQEGRIDRGERLEPFSGHAGANVTACCSAMPTSKVRVGKRAAKRSTPVPSGIAPVTATILGSSDSASWISALAKTLV
jgi:hypothetical protein